MSFTQGTSRHTGIHQQRGTTVEGQGQVGRLISSSQVTSGKKPKRSWWSSSPNLGLHEQLSLRSGRFRRAGWCRTPSTVCGGKGPSGFWRHGKIWHHLAPILGWSLGIARADTSMCCSNMFKHVHNLPHVQGPHWHFDGKWSYITGLISRSLQAV